MKQTETQFGEKKRVCRWLQHPGGKTLLASLLCVAIGLLVGFLCLLCINAQNAGDGILTILKNFMNYGTKEWRVYYLGSTLIKSVPLIVCGLSVMFAYKTGLFNIGVGGQYCAGICAALYAALAWHLPWYLCILLAMLTGAVLGVLSGVLKAYLNVNEVISGIMINWISLYLTNMILSDEKIFLSDRSTTLPLRTTSPKSLIPDLGLSKLFYNNPYVTLAPIFTVLLAVIVAVLLNKRVLGYELKATGLNRHAASYAGMREKKNIVLTMAIAGALAGGAAAFYYLTGIEQWKTASTVPLMGFHGIAVAFLGGLNPFGILVSGFFVEHIKLGGSFLDTGYYSPQVAELIVAIIIYLCAFVLIFRQLLQRTVFSVKRKQKDKQTGGASDNGGDVA